MIVTGRANASNTSGTSITTSSFTPSDDSLLIVVGHCQRSGTGPVAPSISDSLGGAWTLYASAASSASNGVWTYLWARVIRVGQPMTVTVSDPNALPDGVVANVFDVTGADLASPVGLSGSDSGTTRASSSYSVSLGGTTSSDSLVVGALVVDTDSITMGAGFSNIYTGTGGLSNYLSYCEEYQTGALSSATWTFASNFSWAAVAVEIKVAPPGALYASALGDISAVSEFVGTGEFEHPDADSLVGGWLDQNGAASALYAAIDEATSPNDSDYIISSATPALDVCKISLGNPTVTPAEPMFVRYRIWNTRPGEGAMECRVRLLEGTTQRASWTESNVSGTPQTFVRALSSGEFAAITDFTNLFLEFRANHQA